jgi:hypothetical protein
LLNDGLIKCAELDIRAAIKIAHLAQQYADIRPQLADLSLVYVAEQEKSQIVFTLDRRDFAIYRDSRGRPFQLIP